MRATWWCTTTNPTVVPPCWSSVDLWLKRLWLECCVRVQALHSMKPLENKSTQDLWLTFCRASHLHTLWKIWGKNYLVDCSKMLLDMARFKKSSKDTHGLSLFWNCSSLGKLTAQSPHAERLVAGFPIWNTFAEEVTWLAKITLWDFITQQWLDQVSQEDQWERERERESEVCIIDNELELLCSHSS